MNAPLEEANAGLIKQARAGDARAFEALAKEVERPLYRHVQRIVGESADAEDCVQDALFSAWRSIRAFEGDSFRAWIFRIATNRALDRLRSRKRHPELPLERDDLLGDGGLSERQLLRRAGEGTESGYLAEGADAARLLKDIPASVGRLERAGHLVEREAAHHALQPHCRHGRGRRHRGRRERRCGRRRQRGRRRLRRRRASRRLERRRRRLERSGRRGGRGQPRRRDCCGRARADRYDDETKCEPARSY